MTISLRKFQEEDVPYKVQWINDDQNNKYLHYDLPLKEDKTISWFKTLENRIDRVDYTITYNGEPAGLIGLLNIDVINKKAEYYICLGGNKFKGKGIASIATKLLIEKSYKELGLQKIYLYTEVDNTPAQKLFEKVDFKKEGLLKNDLINNGKKIDRFVYGLVIAEWINE
ncbi:GNAT family N-acetyltransferase [Paenisporosarcina antarctica]|uniref:N-acetyltransferase n=1 Tax=Paenisporosarcina antarctica TaxID=417367 RepID=A0A4P6ZZU3_9BACL|nr:GNAT family protein [Paenisporosarcina antarctica]QBP42017.1 N-acetyltransferase [Paenisporosarcina antarctica]